MALRWDGMLLELAAVGQKPYPALWAIAPSDVGDVLLIFGRQVAKLNQDGLFAVITLIFF